MRYMIEFELPDNDTILQEIKNTYVPWAVWGYSGICRATPSVDVGPVVRCRDCKHRDPKDKKCNCGYIYLNDIERPVMAIKDVTVYVGKGNGNETD